MGASSSHREGVRHCWSRRLGTYAPASTRRRFINRTLQTSYRRNGVHEFVLGHYTQNHDLGLPQIFVGNRILCRGPASYCFTKAAWTLGAHPPSNPPLARDWRSVCCDQHGSTARNPGRRPALGARGLDARPRSCRRTSHVGRVRLSAHFPRPACRLASIQR